MKRICVIDGQGGGIGATLIKYLKDSNGESVELIGLETNAIATAQMLKAGMLSAAFFVASLVHVPIGPSNAHLVLNGLVGILLGWAAFPAILVALALQAVFFQFGGITTIGVNTLIMALPAIICYLIFGRLIHKSPRTDSAAAFACGFLSGFLAGLLLGVALIFTEENFLEVSGIVVATHVPVMIIEGIITAVCVAFLRKARPEMLPGYRG